jgi:hypothetical protein
LLYHVKPTAKLLAKLDARPTERDTSLTARANP